MKDCLFCKIISGELPAHKIYEDEHCLAFWDMTPVVPVHFLVIPKQHIASAQDIMPEHTSLIGHIFFIVAKLAGEYALTNGFRVLTNSGIDADQTVLHLHFHVLGGQRLPSKQQLELG